MNLILTHEQADFDSIASQLGAYLVNHDAQPILPRRMNRNVVSFLSIYENQLPFISQQTRQVSSINQITLVDTQSLATLRGMNETTAVNVIDHHPLKAGVPSDWNINLVDLGACTTYFVEQIRDTSVPINELHATLLLLGIYEDTGSLTYANTTPRDIYAAGYLVENGADLGIANEYLNPPLSLQQRGLYNTLLAAVESHTINGQNVIITQSEALQISDEVSSVAHKLRDLLDPDALFVLVATSDGIRLVARSTTNYINVGQIAAHFSGGGHKRAAAALVLYPPDTSENVTQFLLRTHQELISILPKFIKPSITVGQIMSIKPFLLSPDTLANEAIHTMQRFGYEGYPVVEGDKVVGLLNRRAVDRTIVHKLNLPVKQLMEAGEVFISPNDSIEHLQMVMNSTGWGQVPVVSPQTGKIVGIVTRTDLLSTITNGNTGHTSRQNISSRLETILPKGEIALLKLISAEATKLNFAIYIVGGFVRDLLLNRPSKDFDLVVEGNAIDLGRALVKRYGGKIVKHGRFGTAKWKIESISSGDFLFGDENVMLNASELPQSIDLITARTEFYEHPTALPTVERSSIKLDLHRRDFTINTMALRLDGNYYGELYDYWGGLHDLRKGLVKVLHSLSFVDDPTRMLRAVRFEQRFKFSIEDRTAEMMSEAYPLLHQLSGDRIRHEFNLIFMEESAIQTMQRLNQLGLLSVIHPELSWSEAASNRLLHCSDSIENFLWSESKLASQIQYQAAVGYLAWWLDLPVELIRDLSQRFRLPAELNTSILMVKEILENNNQLVSMLPSQIVDLLDKAPKLSLDYLSCTSQSKEIKSVLKKYKTEWKAIKPFTSGDELRAMGIPPGPVYRIILQQIRDAWLNGLIKTYEEELQLLRRIVQDQQSGLKNHS